MGPAIDMGERADYRTFYDSFDATELFDALHGDLTTAINACIECCDRHVGKNRLALNWESATGTSKTYTFEEFHIQSAQVANLLVANGVEPGDRVAGLLPRVPELVALILGVWRAGAVYQPLFTAFGQKTIEHRLATSDTRVVVTDVANRSKLDDLAVPPIIMCSGGHASDVEFTAAVQAQPIRFEPIMRKGDDAFLMMFTSGTTGLPKGMKIPLRALAGIHAYMRFALDLLPEDIFWNIADPGWAYGLYYGLIGPLLMGHQTVLYDGPFTVESTASLVQRLGVSNFAGPPTAYRMIIAEGAEAAQPLTDNLRVASSSGEPLNPEVMRWFKQHINCHLFDHYGQTECGVVLANHHGLSHEVRAGSTGLPLPGFRLDVLNEKGSLVPQGIRGILAVHCADSPLFSFDGYLGADGQSWAGDYYLTGDIVERSGDGTFSFVGRSDDLIMSSGYRIGPFDVESCLLEHDAVVESAVVGKQDERRGEIVKAFVVLHPGHTGDESLAEDLKQYVRNRLGKHAFPREVVFLESLPKTSSGKIRRFVLRKD